MEIYASTSGTPTRFGQIQAMTIRRLKTFYREPRQVFLVILPFLNIAVVCLAISGIFMMFTAGVDEDDKNENQWLQVIFSATISTIFPFMLSYGFCTSAGSYALMPVSERENETRSILHTSGMSSWAYWTGLLLADIIVYLVLTVMFCIFIVIA